MHFVKRVKGAVASIEYDVAAQHRSGYASRPPPRGVAFTSERLAMKPSVATAPSSVDIAGKVAQLYQKRAQVAGERFAEAAQKATGGLPARSCSR